MQLEEVPEKPTGVEGALVKVTPQLTPAARASFDGPKTVARLQAAGARAVLLQPTSVPGEGATEVQELPKALSPEVHIAEWFAGAGLDDVEREQAESMALELLEDVRGA